MTRREKRYNRRSSKRAAKRNAFLRQFDDFNIILNKVNLFNAADLAKKHVMWKASVQNWSINQLYKTEELYRDLQKGKDVRKGFSHFITYERGKRRYISAVKFYERVVQKCLCKYILYPVYTHSLIYDNSASQKGKGTKFAIDRFVKKLKRFYRKNGNNGFILMIDFKGYFDNINHDVLKSLYRNYFKDEKLLRLIDLFVDAYGRAGLGLGSETSQMHAIMYPNIIDHAITEKIGRKIYYGRYMDDSYIIAKDKPTLYKALDIIKKLCEKLKIILSPKKTKIINLKNTFSYLKTRFNFSQKGKIIKRPCRSTVQRMRRRLVKLIRLLKTDQINYACFQQSFESWAGSLKRRNARRSVWNLRRYLRKEINYAYKIRNKRTHLCMQTGNSRVRLCKTANRC